MTLYLAPRRLLDPPKPRPKRVLPIRKDVMRNMMRTVGKVGFFGLMMVASAVGQRLQSGPAPAVAGPAYDVSVGYTYQSMPIASAGRVGLNGLDSSASLAL